MELPQCEARLETPRPTRFFCRHPHARASDQFITVEDCRACLAWRDPLSEPLLHPRLSRTVETWAVGVTSARRQSPTLERTLDSLSAAGWDCPRLFTEPGVKLAARFRKLPRTRRDKTIGAFPNWYLGLAELVMREPRAEAYLMVQDDVIFAQGVRAFLEFTLWPSFKTGAVSIYCPSDYAVASTPGFHREDRGWRTWTAQALVFPNPTARALVAAGQLVAHRYSGPHDGLRNIDCIVGKWCREARRPFYVIYPSLAEHIGETSTLYPHATVSGRRKSSSFVGEDVDVTQTPPWPLDDLDS